MQGRRDAPFPSPVAPNPCPWPQPLSYCNSTWPCAYCLVRTTSPSDPHRERDVKSTRRTCSLQYNIPAAKADSIQPGSTSLVTSLYSPSPRCIHRHLIVLTVTSLYSPSPRCIQQCCRASKTLYECSRPVPAFTCSWVSESPFKSTPSKPPVGPSHHTRAHNGLHSRPEQRGVHFRRSSHHWLSDFESWRPQVAGTYVSLWPEKPRPNGTREASWTRDKLPRPP